MATDFFHWYKSVLVYLCYICPLLELDFYNISLKKNIKIIKWQKIDFPYVFVQEEFLTLK